MEKIKPSIVQHELTEIDITLLKFDKNNPNEMTEEEENGLFESMKSFGYDEFVLVQRNLLDEKTGDIKKKTVNLIANGEHRVKQLLKDGHLTVKCVYRDMKESERLMLRQTHNKIKGIHDIVKDALELEKLKAFGVSSQLQLMLAMSQAQYENLIKLADQIIPVTNEPITFDVTIKHRCIVPDCDHGNN